MYGGQEEIVYGGQEEIVYGGQEEIVYGGRVTGKDICGVPRLPVRC